MLSTLLDRLGGLLSRQFVISYFVPALLFAFLNAMMLGWQSPDFRAWAPAQFEGFKGFYALPLLFAIAVVAYLVLSVNVYLRQILEGRRLLPQWLTEDWARRETERRNAIIARFQNARNDFYRVKEQSPRWRQSLVEASDIGHAVPSSTTQYGPDAEAAKLVAELWRKRAHAEPVTAEGVAAAVAELETVLRSLDRGGQNDSSRRLNDDYDQILQIFDYAVEVSDVERATALNLLQTYFGAAQPLPTRMGNIAAALDSYAQTRYRMNLAIYWNRMQHVLQANEKHYDALLDAKAQFDFLVVCCWLCMLTSALWLVAMPWLHFSWPFYAIVCIIGPVFARGFYLLSLENYIVMADLVKSAVDLFRFDLLKSLHMPQPNNIREERALWAALSEIDQDALEISYAHNNP